MVGVALGRELVSTRKVDSPFSGPGDKSGELSGGCSCQTRLEAAAMQLSHRLPVTTASVLPTPLLHRQQLSSGDFKAGSFQHRTSLEGHGPLFGSPCPSTIGRGKLLMDLECREVDMTGQLSVEPIFYAWL